MLLDRQLHAAQEQHWLSAGMGVTGLINGKKTAIGNKALLIEEGVQMDESWMKAITSTWGARGATSAMRSSKNDAVVVALLSSRLSMGECSCFQVRWTRLHAGATLCFVSHAKQLIGALAVADAVRPESAVAVTRLKVTLSFQVSSQIQVSSMTGPPNDLSLLAEAGHLCQDAYR